MTQPRFTFATRQRIFRMAAAGGLIFAVMTFGAMLAYPGGTLEDASIDGYRFEQNFFSDLGRTRDFEGNPQLASMLLFSGGLITVGCTTALFFLALPDLFNKRSGLVAKGMMALGLLAGVGFLGIAVTPWDLFRGAHDFCVNLGFRSLLLACIAAMVGIYQTKSFPNGFGHLMVFESTILLGYILLLQFGPAASTPRGLLIQVGGQKVVAYVLVGGITALAFGALQVNLRMAEQDSTVVPGSGGKGRMLKKPQMSAALCGVGVVGFVGWMLFAYLGYGPTPPRDDWPMTLESMVETTEADTSDLELRGLFVGIVDSAAVWRLKLTPEQKQKAVDYLSSRELEIQGSDTVPPTFEAAFPWRWRPIRHTDCEFYRTPNFDWDDRGLDGNHYALMYDPQRQYLYVWNKDNF